MPLMTARAVASLGSDLLAAHSALMEPREGALGKVARYLRGEHDLPYMPKGARAEYKHLAQRSITNWLPLISDTFAKGLFVDGYRAAKAGENSKPWTYWQANGLDARQAVVHRSALEYGVGYTMVLPGDSAPVIKALPATRVLAMYEDDEAEWPVHAMIRRGVDVKGALLLDVVDDQAVYTLRKPKDSDDLELVSTAEHGLGVTPLIRFRERLDGVSVGIIRPQIPLQDRINEAVFSLLVALQYASFRQRWATGLAIPVDEDQYLSDGVTPNPNFGKPVQPFQAAVDRLWVTDNPEARFGDFAQTDVSGHLRTYESAVRSLAAIAQTPPHVLLGDLVNLSADALAAAEASTQRKTGEYETLFGESWEQTLRLAALADGDSTAASDTASEVRWRDTEARSLAQTVDALGKIAQMLGVPAEGLWDRIPGVTPADVARWHELAQSGDGLKALADALTQTGQAQPPAATAPSTATTAAPPAPAPGSPTPGA